MNTKTNIVLLKKMKDLLNEIAFCKNVEKVLSNDSHCSCKKIIKSQKKEYSSFQLPEPWNGDIKNCKILFISSNPSIDEREKYPTNKWDKSEIEDFFINRFSCKKKWVKNELRPLMINKDNIEYYPSPKKWVRFWGSVRSTAKDILNSNKVIAGVDYAITEIVHCKSTSEIGVKEALETCADKYLDRILMLTNARVFVCLGDKVSSYIKERYSLTEDGLVAEFPKTNQLLIFLPHPNSRKTRKIRKLFSEEKLNSIRERIKEKR